MKKNRLVLVLVISYALVILYSVGGKSFAANRVVESSEIEMTNSAYENY